MMILLMGFGAHAAAATWVLGSGSGQPGETIDLPITFRGDGRTVGADITVVLDPARLTIDAPAGELEDAAEAGRCGWNGTDEAGALLFSDEKPLSEDDTLVCLLRVRIRPTAPASHVTLRANAAHCAAENGLGGTCAVATGTVVILGLPPEPRPPATESLSLVVLLDDAAPSARAVVEEGAQNSVIEAFRREPPHALRTVFAARDPVEAGLPGDADDPVLQARMARYLVADYASLDARDRALALLLVDPLVAGASPDTEMPFASGGDAPASKALLQQQHIDDLGLETLWARAGGWGLVGAVDSGITADHPELRSFTGPRSISGAWVSGGNYLPYFSSNLGLKGQSADDLSETQPSIVDASDTCGNGLIYPTTAGHGTHVSGLIASNASDLNGAAGACKYCGLGMRKTSFVACVQGFGAVVKNVHSNVAAGIEQHVREGVQVINLSVASYKEYCHYIGNTEVGSVCDAIAFAVGRDVVLVAAAGNNLSGVGFPATDPRVLAVAGIVGLDQNALPVWWTESPNCPLPPNGPILKPECGSNFRQGSIPGVQPPAFTNYIELLAPAKSVMSTFVPGWNWHDGIACGDSHDGVDGDGFGPCTGTSMSTPQIAGVAGVLRSIHPLLVAGTPWTNPTGIRGLLRTTASRSLAGLANDFKLGFGIPNASIAADRLLGTVGKEIAKNRVTPLFGLYSPGLDDYAAVATPQLAMALRNVIPALNAYRSTHQNGDSFVQGLKIPGYAAFPGAGAGEPRALAFVLTTEHSRAGLPTPVPLYLLARSRQQATTVDDHLLVDQSLVQKAADAGYAFAGRQGFIYPWCPAAGCNPAGTQALHLKCKNAGNPVTRRCAVFLESQRVAFEGKGYTALFPGAIRSQLGFAYPVADSDGDDLVDAAEWVIGTSTALSNSDGDSASDAQEYPLAGLPVSDPCDGPSVQCPYILNRLFKDSFE